MFRGRNIDFGPCIDIAIYVQSFGRHGRAPVASGLSLPGLRQSASMEIGHLVGESTIGQTSRPSVSVGGLPPMCMPTPDFLGSTSGVPANR